MLQGFNRHRENACRKVVYFYKLFARNQWQACFQHLRSKIVRCDLLSKSVMKNYCLNIFVAIWTSNNFKLSYVE